MSAPDLPDPTDEDLRRLRAAVELAYRCPPSDTAFSVGAVLVGSGGDVLAQGYSRRCDPHDHAEEDALAQVGHWSEALRGATLYSSLEPCSTRTSRARSCSELILTTPIARVVFAWREPSLFVDCVGAERLRSAGRTVIEVPELAARARAANRHLLG